MKVVYSILVATDQSDSTSAQLIPFNMVKSSSISAVRARQEGNSCSSPIYYIILEKERKSMDNSP